jgi:uncharacterized protein (UPF0371 family)
MGLLKKIVEKIDQAADKKIDTTVEQAGVKPADRKPAPAPKKQAPKADSSVVAPTPMGGLSCLVRAAELLGIAGVVAVTASAALVGRCRR